MRYPFLQEYYSPALPEEPGQSREPVIWSQAETPTRDAFWNSVLTASAIGGLFAAGNIPVGNQRVWDYYVKGLRSFEDYFIGQVPRTLQLSNILSQFETPALQTRVISPNVIKDYSLTQLDYLSRLTDTSVETLRKKGLTFEKGQLFVGTGIEKELSLANASVIRNINKSPHFSVGYARSLGTEVSQAADFGESLSFLDDKGVVQNEVFQIIGGKNKAEHLKRQLFGYGSELMERVNRLATSPMEIPGLGDFFRKYMKLDVKSGPGLPMLGRMIGKYTAIGAGALVGYGMLDWAVRDSSIFDNTLFDQGITGAAATVWTRANLAFAKFGDITGWTDYSRAQEEIAPGSTDLQRLLAFPAIGAVIGATTHYAERVALMTRLQLRKKMDSSKASEVASRFMRSNRGGRWVAKLGQMLSDSKYAAVRQIGKSRLLMRSLIGAAALTPLILPFLPGALAPNETYEELSNIYSGAQEVAVRKGRFWELGRTPYEGGQIEYFRPHWYPRMLMDAEDKSIWGPVSDDGELSPLTKFYKSNFTYDLEQAHYYDRPYPVTGRAFYDFPIIGPILSATLGKIFKPQKYMHTEEWASGGEPGGEGTSYLHMPPGFGKTYQPGMGELPPGAPVTPHGAEAIAGEQAYRMMELVGMPGFIAQEVKEAITGTQTPYEEMQLASADQIDSISRKYWDMQLGGMALSNELLRRLIPNRRTSVQQYNPLRNQMPDWLPGPGDISPDFLHGDPYAAVKEGELRLPGIGYAQRFPELEGVDPRDYPAVHRYKILSDVAMYSSKFKFAQSEMKGLHAAGQLSPEEELIFQETERQVKAKKDKIEFHEYKYRKPNLDPVMEELAAWNESQKQDKGPSWFDSVVGGYWETLSHNVETSFEQLTPLSPAAKLLHMRSAIESYERTQVYGTESSYWDRPWANFIRPFLTTTANAFGISSEIPADVQQRRNIEEYFDILKYVKYSRMQNMAETADDETAAKIFARKKRETLFGVNPFTLDMSQVYRGLPKRDRDYFSAFSSTEDIDERGRILSLIPENEKGLMMARWLMNDKTQFQKAIDLGILSADAEATARARIEQIDDQWETQGFERTDELWQEYIKTRLSNETYPDWYRRTKLLEKRLDALDMSLPGPDWVGFRPEVDLDDIKLKLVQNLGDTMQDYDLWADRERGLLRKPYINDQAIEGLMNEQSIEGIRSNIRELLSAEKIYNSDISITMVPGHGPAQIDMDFQEDRTQALEHALKRLNNG